MEQEAVHKLVVGTFNTDLGKKLMEHLKKSVLERPTYKKGDTLDEVAFKEGQKNIIDQFIKELK